jgi:hypothetical protein
MPPTVISCSGEFKSFKPFNRFAQFKSFNEMKPLRQHAQTLDRKKQL